MFQFNPETYDWFGWIRSKPETEQWLTSRYIRFICKDDKAVIWCSGENGGILAMGLVTTYPQKSALAPEQALHYRKKDDVMKFLKKPSVIIKYTKLFVDRPILQDKCRKDKILSSMDVFKNPEGTNFKIAKKHWNRIIDLTDV
jgi:hypothetical protein